MPAISQHVFSLMHLDLPATLTGPFCADHRGLPRYCSTIWIDVLNGHLARPTRKHDAIIDIERYFSVQSTSAKDLELQLGGTEGGRLFQRYGASEKERCHSINPHSLRDLQNTELFSRGVADTVISRRYNRKGVDQSYVYDHRTLAEHLEEMEPDTARLAKSMLGPKARQAFDLIRGGKIAGPVVSTFQRIQLKEGDEAAFEFLNAEAGALHFTPYGFCLNSFAASPCVKHLECFNRCGHLVRTDAPEEQQNLTELRRTQHPVSPTARNSRSSES